MPLNSENPTRKSFLTIPSGQSVSGKKPTPNPKDRISDSSAYSTSASEFYDNNSGQMTETAATLGANIDITAMKDKIKAFSESSRILMKALDEVQKLHPFIGVAVLAFKGVANLELKRRDNNATVGVLQVTMQDLMTDFVQLRAIKPEQELFNGTTVAQVLADLCNVIADDIENCGNICDKYSKTSFWGKLFKSPIYHERLSDLIQTFETRKKDLNNKLVLFTALGVDSANIGLTQVQETVKSTEENIKILMMLQRLQSPLEQRIWKVIEENGGPSLCIADNTVMDELYSMMPGGKPLNSISTAYSTVQIDPKQEETTPTGAPPPNNAPSMPHPQTTGTAVSPIGTSSSHPLHHTAPSPGDGLHSILLNKLDIPRNVASPPPMVHAQYPFPDHTRLPFSRTSSSSFDQSQPVSRQNSFDPPRSNLSQVYTSSMNRDTRPFIPPHARSFISRSNTTMTSQSDESGKSGRVRSHHIPSPVLLMEEMAEDVDTGLRRNMHTFKRKLHEQQRQLKALEMTVIRQGHLVVSELSQKIQEGPHNRVQHPQLRELWKEMGWKLSVPDREFVLNLHDYYMAQYFEPTEVEDYFNRPPPEGSTIEQQRIALKKALDLAKARTEDKWALKLLTFQNIPKILEAFDGDASGFVSVWEVNEFTSGCPDGWSLLQWLAYWVLGSHLTILDYRSKICAILHQMHNMAQLHKLHIPRKQRKLVDNINSSILSANKHLVDEYLDGIRELDFILASIQPCVTESWDIYLGEMSTAYVKAEESRVNAILRALDYEIDGADTISLIIGRHQIERNLFPVLYILLKRHLEIFNQARETILSRHELASALNSVRYILETIDLRMENLEISYRDVQQFNPASVFSTFAFGLYSRLRYGPATLHLKDLHDLHPTVEIELSAVASDDSILKSNAPCDTNPYTPLVIHDAIPTGSESGVRGSWTGHFRDSTSKIAPYGMIHFFVESAGDLGQFEGHGSYCAGILHVAGEEHGGTTVLKLSGSPDDPIADRALQFVITFQGEMQSVDGQMTISGEWKSSTEAGTLLLSRQPTWYYRLKLELMPYRPPGSLWRFACGAGKCQGRLNRGMLPVADIMEMRRGAELTRYQFLLGDIAPMDREEFQALLYKSSPWEARVYRCAARTSIEWTLHTNAVCNVCHRSVILGTRHHCLECAMNFCETCVGHTEEHHILRLHSYVNDRGHILLSHKAKQILWTHSAMVVVQAASPSPQSDKTKTVELPPEDNLRTPKEVDHQPQTLLGLPRVPSARQLSADSQNSGVPTDILKTLKEHDSPQLTSYDHAPILRRSFTQRSLTQRSDEISEKSDENSEVGEDEDHSPLLCISCKGSTHGQARYWVCIHCTQVDSHHVRICENCETRRRPQYLGVRFASPTHHRNHPLVRVDEQHHPESRKEDGALFISPMGSVAGGR